MIILAQSSHWSAPPGLIGWLMCALFIVWSVERVLSLVDRIKGKKHEIAPQPFQIEHTEPCAKKSELDRHIRETQENFKESEKQRGEDLKNAALARKRMHEDIERVSNKVSTLAATTDAQTRQLDRLDSKLDTMPDRLIANLKNLKG